MKKILILTFTLLLSFQFYAFGEKDVFVGTVGQKKVKLELKLNDELTQSLSSCVDFTGTCTYTATGKTSKIEGYFQPWPGMSGDPDGDYPVYGFEELSKTGKPIANWYFTLKGGYWVGKKTIKATGKKLKVSLKNVN